MSLGEKVVVVPPGISQERGLFCSFHTRLSLKPEGMMALEGPGPWGGGRQVRPRRALRPRAAVTGSEPFWTRERRCWGSVRRHWRPSLTIQKGLIFSGDKRNGREPLEAQLSGGAVTC